MKLKALRPNTGFVQHFRRKAHVMKPITLEDHVFKYLVNDLGWRKYTIKPGRFKGLRGVLFAVAGLFDLQRFHQPQEIFCFKAEQSSRGGAVAVSLPQSFNNQLFSRGVYAVAVG